MIVGIIHFIPYQTYHLTRQHTIFIIVFFLLAINFFPKLTQ